MALNVGHDFKKRWLDAPEAVRQTFKEDLARICDLLQPQTPIQLWIEQDQQQQQHAHEKIEQAYAKLKAELIEQARIRKQRHLNSLYHKNVNSTPNRLRLYMQTKHTNNNNKPMP